MAARTQRTQAGTLTTDEAALLRTFAQQSARYPTIERALLGATEQRAARSLVRRGLLMQGTSHGSRRQYTLDLSLARLDANPVDLAAALAAVPELTDR